MTIVDASASRRKQFEEEKESSAMNQCVQLNQLSDAAGIQLHEAPTRSGRVPFWFCWCWCGYRDELCSSAIDRSDATNTRKELRAPPSLLSRGRGSPHHVFRGRIDGSTCRVQIESQRDALIPVAVPPYAARPLDNGCPD